MMLLNRKTLILFAMVLLHSFGCDKHTAPSPTTAQLTALQSKRWEVKTVKVDNVDQTPLFASMTLNFGAGTYSTTHGGVIWPATGTWEFTDAQGKTLKRSDGLEINITEARPRR